MKVTTYQGFGEYRLRLIDLRALIAGKGTGDFYRMFYVQTKSDQDQDFRIVLPFFQCLIVGNTKNIRSNQQPCRYKSRIGSSESLF